MHAAIMASGEHFGNTFSPLQPTFWYLYPCRLLRELRTRCMSPSTILSCEDCYRSSQDVLGIKDARHKLWPSCHLTLSNSHVMTFETKSTKTSMFMSNSDVDCSSEPMTILCQSEPRQFVSHPWISSQAYNASLPSADPIYAQTQ